MSSTSLGPGSAKPDNRLGPARPRRGDAPPRSTTKGDMPPALLDRYLIERDRRGRPERFFRDVRAPEPAFRDHGGRLSTTQAYPDTIADMLKVARHRGWTRLRVEGDEAFRRDVWIQARAQGLEVSGYKPRGRDRQAAGEAPSGLETRSNAEHRLRMAEVVIRNVITDPQARRRLLDYASELVGRRHGLECEERARPQSRPMSRDR